MPFFRTAGSERVLLRLDEAYERKNSLREMEVAGPPGVGKSLTSCFWAQQKSCAGVSVSWTSFPQGVGCIRFVILRQNLIISTVLSQDEINSVVASFNTCSVVMLDGLNQMNEYQLPKSWPGLPSLVVRVCSEANVSHDNLIRAHPWTIEVDKEE